MAFSIDCTMKGYEVRGVESGVSKKGKAYRSIRVESPQGRTAEISSSDAELFGYIDILKKAQVCNFDVRAVAGRERSYIILQRPPVIVVDDNDAIADLD